MTIPHDDKAPHKKSGLFKAIIALFAGLLFVLFLGLGIWQVERLQWKLALIDRVESRIHAAPMVAPMQSEWAKVNRNDDEYRRVSISGAFMNDKEVVVKALTERGSGYWVMTPIRTADGSITFINRGFVPDSKRDQASRPESLIEGQTTVTGLLRMPEPDGFFLRPNNPERNEWNSRDVAAFAIKQNLNPVAPFFIDAEASADRNALPIGGLTVVSFRNNHLSYAITWFALAAMVAGAAVFVWRHERKSAA